MAGPSTRRDKRLPPDERAVQPSASARSAVSPQPGRVLAVASPRRLPAFPDVPAVAEAADLPGFDPVTWTGFCAPEGTSQAAIDRIQREVANVLATPEIAQRLVQDGLEPVGSTPGAFRQFLVADKRKWGTVIRDGNIKSD